MTLKNIIGDVYGRLCITELLPRTSHNRKVGVVCECGTHKEVFLGDLRTGRTTSCGCLLKEISTTHGQSRNGNPLYRVWASMKFRATDPTHPNYGGRGIGICPEWEDFEVFNTWAELSGYKKGLTLDRKDNQQGYSPANCRWATPTTQSRNRRSAKGASSMYIGVYFCNTRQMWVAQITVDKKKKTLGLFHTDLEAAKAREEFIKDNSLANFTLNNV